MSVFESLNKIICLSLTVVESLKNGHTKSAKVQNSTKNYSFIDARALKFIFLHLQSFTTLL